VVDRVVGPMKTQALARMQGINDAFSMLRDEMKAGNIKPNNYKVNQIDNTLLKKLK